jgi:hypothetical protein
MRVRAILLLVLMVGCQKPPFPRLAELSQATVFDAREKSIHVDTDAGDGLAGADYQWLDVGTKVLVIADHGVETSARRSVRIRVEDGEHKGLIAQIERWALRP